MSRDVFPESFLQRIVVEIDKGNGKTKKENKFTTFPYLTGPELISSVCRDHGLDASRSQANQKKTACRSSSISWFNLVEMREKFLDFDKMSRICQISSL